MKCQKVRTIFDLLEIFNCQGCVKYLMDYDILIGAINLSVYYLNCGCRDLVNENLYSIAKSLKVKLFLKDMIINSDKDLLFLWCDYEESEIKENHEILLAFDSDVHMLVTN